MQKLLQTDFTGVGVIGVCGIEDYLKHMVDAVQKQKIAKDFKQDVAQAFQTGSIAGLALAIELVQNVLKHNFEVTKKSGEQE
jgi:hypothetical protein